MWFVIFQAGLAVGFGLAQPWFEPVKFLSQVLAGQGIEFVFGIASSGGTQKGFAMGASGFMWVVFNLVDWAVMFLFLAMFPWLSDRTEDEDAADSPPRPKPKSWMNLAGWIVVGVMGLAMLVDFYNRRSGPGSENRPGGDQIRRLRPSPPLGPAGGLFQRRGERGVSSGRNNRRPGGLEVGSARIGPGPT